MAFCMLTCLSQKLSSKNYLRDSRFTLEVVLLIVRSCNDKFFIKYTIQSMNPNHFAYLSQSLECITYLTVTI